MRPHRHRDFWRKNKAVGRGHSAVISNSCHPEAPLFGAGGPMQLAGTVQSEVHMSFSL